MKPYRSEKWLQAVRDLGECVCCGAHGVQAAHRNEGKGMGTKVSDALTAALCPNCHFLIDHGVEMTRSERRAEMDRAIVLTLDRLVRAGKVGVL
jgi:hypothetical protein